MPANSFKLDALRLISGTVVSQGIAVAMMPVLAWFFPPESFGTAAIFLSMTLVIGVVACLRYEAAIVLPDSDDEAANLLVLCLLMATAVALVLGGAVAFGGDTLIDLWQREELRSVLWLLPLAVLTHGWFLALSYWQTRSRRFGFQSSARVAGAVTQSTTGLVAGSAGAVSGAYLIAAQILGQLASSILIVGWTWRLDRHLFYRSVRSSEIWAGFVRHRKFPIYDSGAALLNTVSANLPVFLFAFFFSPAVVGFYSLGHRMLNVPLSLVGRSLAQVVFQRAAQAQAKGTLPELVQTVLQGLLLVSLFPFAWALVNGPELMTAIFGDRWGPAGLYMQIMTPWILMNFLYVPFSHLFGVLDVQESGLAFNAVLLVTRLVSLVIGGILMSPEIALILFSGTGTILYMLIFGYLLRRSGVSMYALLGAMGRPTVLSLGLVTPSLILKWALPGSVVWLFGLALVQTLAFAALCFHHRHLIRALPA